MSQTRFYGGSDNTSTANETGLKYVKANTKNKSDYLGVLHETLLQLKGEVGADIGRPSAFCCFHLLKSMPVRLIRIPGPRPEQLLAETDVIALEQHLRHQQNKHHAKYVSCGLSDRFGNGIPLDNQGWTLKPCDPGQLFITITTQSYPALPFFVQLIVGNPLVQVGSVEVTGGCKAQPTPTPDPDTPDPTPEPTPDPTPTPGALFERTLHPDTSAFHRPLILRAMDLLERYVQPHPANPRLARHAQWSAGQTGNVIASAGPLTVDMLQNADGTPAGVNTTTFQLNVNPGFDSRFTEDEWVAVWAHELFHALGILYWRVPRINDFMGHTSNSQTMGYLTIGEFSQAVAGYREHVGVNDSPIVPLNAVNGGHWARTDSAFSAYPGRTFPGTRALMTPSAEQGLVITDITLGALEGYGYVVNKVGAGGVAPRAIRLPESFVCGVDLGGLEPPKARIRRI